MKKVFAIILMFSLAVSILSFSACGKNSELISKANSIVVSRSISTSDYFSFNVSTSKDQYTITAIPTAKFKNDYNEAVNKSQYPDITRQIYLNSLTASMKTACEDVYDSVSDVFKGTNTVITVIMMGPDGGEVGRYNGRSWT